MGNLHDTKNYYRTTLPNGTLDKAIEDLNFINQKIDYASKILTAFDFYKITSIVNSPSEFEAKVNLLLNTNAVLINSDSFSKTVNGVLDNYSRGDIVYRDTEGELHHIAAQRGGIYYPSNLVNNDGIYTLSFTASTVEPTKGSTGYIGTFAETIKMTFSNLNTQSVTGIYGKKITNDGSSISFPAVYAVGTSTPITPIIKLFTVNGEEVDFNFTITLSGTTYTISSLDARNASDEQLISYIIIK